MDCQLLAGSQIEAHTEVLSNLGAAQVNLLD